MTELRLEIDLDIDEIRDVLKESMEEAGFLLVDEYEDLDGGFRMLGVNEKRRSMVSNFMIFLIGGYIPRNRVALELNACRSDNFSIVVFRCIPYLDDLDMETTSQTPQESKRCENIARGLEKKILEKLSGTLTV